MTFGTGSIERFRNGNKKLRGITALWIFISVFALTQCSESENPIVPVPDEEEPEEFMDPLEGLPDEGAVSFVNPAVGQRSYYVLFEATKANGIVDLQYQADTLVFAITGKQSDTWVVSEFLTERSNSRVDPGNSYFGNMGDTLFVCHLQFQSDSIQYFKDPEKLFVSFAFHREQKFPLQLVSDKFPKNPDGLPLFAPTGARWMEYTENFTLFGKTYDRLNMYFNYIETGWDGFGYTYVYSPSDGLIRSAWVNYWSPDEAEGWDLLPR